MTPKGVRYETEDGKMLDAAANRGSHVGGLDKEGDGVELTIAVPKSGAYVIRVYHTAPVGKATHTYTVDATAKGKVTYGGTLTGWGVFDTVFYAKERTDRPAVIMQAVWGLER